MSKPYLEYLNERNATNPEVWFNWETQDWELADYQSLKAAREMHELNAITHQSAWETGGITPQPIRGKLPLCLFCLTLALILILAIVREYRKEVNHENK